MSRFPGVIGLVFVTLAFGAGCATVPYATRTSARPPGDSQGAIFVANGAGGSNATTQALERAVEEEQLPLTVQTLAWSYGYGMFVLDQRDGANAHDAGLELASAVLAYRRQFPGKAVYLLGHSAGSAVILAAAGELPPASVDRIVLLAPSASANHDIRPALRAARLGMHVFYSWRDVAFLGLGTALVGTPDGFGEAAAGRVGFRSRIESPADAALAGKLYQYAWDPVVEWTGNRGGHFGTQADKYLRTYVVPLFLNNISAH